MFLITIGIILIMVLGIIIISIHLTMDLIILGIDLIHGTIETGTTSLSFLNLNQYLVEEDQMLKLL